VTYAGTAGLLQDSANLTFNGTTLTANTIGAFTLSGTVSGGGNNINNVIIGASTPLAGAFTTLSATTSITQGSGASGLILQSHPSVYGAIYSTNVTPSATNYTLVTNGSFLQLNGSSNVNLMVANSSIANATSTGLSITKDLYVNDAASSPTGGIYLGQSGFRASILWNVTTGNLDITPRSGFTTSITAGGLAVTGLISNTVTSNAAYIRTGDETVSGGAVLNLRGNSTAGKSWYITSNYNVANALEFLQGTGGTTPPATAAMTLDSSGNLGIGTSASGYTLHVSNAAPSVRISNTSEAAAQTQTLVFGTTIYNRATIQSVNVGTSGADLTFLTAPAAGSTLERARIDSSGNLGIGTTSPYKSLTVGATDAAAWITAGGPNTNLTISSVGANGSVLFRTGGTISDPSTTTERARIDASGNLGVGTTSPASRLDLGSSYVNPATDTAADVKLSVTTISATEKYGFYVDSTASLVSLAGSNSGGGIFRWVSGSTERARIDSSGNLLVGTTSTPNGTSVSGTLIQNPNTARSRSANTGTTQVIHWSFYNGNGEVGGIYTNGSATTFYTSSDYRLKENVSRMTGALDKVTALNPVTYKWKVDGTEGQGFIAHELQAVIPDAVKGEKDAVDSDGNPEYQGIDTSFLVATLTAAIQEMKAIIDTQALTITTLAARISALESA
jgi:hypothetical protein